MPQIERKDITFESADGHSSIKAVVWRAETIKPWCVLQIAHGMAEHMLRYAGFAAFLAAAGVVVAGNDHIGHGASVASQEELGYFGKLGGRRYALEDMHSLNRQLREDWAGLPVVLLGHSMGSFFVRQYAVQWPHSISGLIISGTGGPNPLAGVGIALAKRTARHDAARNRAERVHAARHVQVLAFGGYLNRIKEPKTPFDWLSRDEALVAAYIADVRSGYRFTANGFHELFCALRDVSSRRWAEGIAKDMPVYLFSGGEDPVGGYGGGAMKVYEWLKDAGVKDVQLRLYPGGRHEMLNEVNREEVYADVLRFLQGHFT